MESHKQLEEHIHFLSWKGGASKSYSPSNTYVYHEYVPVTPQNLQAYNLSNVQILVGNFHHSIGGPLEEVGEAR